MLPSMPLADYRALSARSDAGTSELWLVRPLLGERRAAIDNYCAEHALTPRVDSTNADTRVYRNRLRHELLPVLRTYNPRIDEVLAHTGEVMAGDYEVVREATDAALSAIELPTPPGDDPRVVSFDLAGWRALPVGLQRSTLRAAIVRLRRTLRTSTGSTSSTRCVSDGPARRATPQRLRRGWR